MTNTSDFELGTIHVRPERRLLENGSGAVSVEPLVMQVLVMLGRRAGTVVSRRELFDACWGATVVGEDSLNRVVAVLRKSLKEVSGDLVQIETIAGAGYVLRLPVADRERGAWRENDVQLAIEAGRQSWRLGLPEPDHLRIEHLRHATRAEPGNANAWGMQALLCRYAAEYSKPAATSDYVGECESAAARALALDAQQPEALVALATVVPLFGRWRQARLRLETIIARHPGCAAAVHELAIVEMSSGRIGEAKRLMDALIAADPLAACFNYKSIYQHWSVGDIAGMDHVADRAVQLWPAHPAVWSARFWTLAHSGRAEAARAMVEDSAARPAFPAPMLQFLLTVARGAASGERVEVEQAVRASCAAAERGPAMAVAALLALGLFDAVDEAFRVSYAYYARSGGTPVPVRHTPSEPSINDQHRRITQPLFTPAAAAMRSDPRFADLCERIGLTAYWRESGLSPDFLRDR